MGYYFVDSKGRDKLFVPRNLIMIEDGSSLQVILNPNKLSRPKAYLRRNSRALKKGLIAVVDVPNKELEELREFCFNGQEAYADSKGREIFYLVKREWRKLEIYRRWQ